VSRTVTLAAGRDLEDELGAAYIVVVPDRPQQPAQLERLFRTRLSADTMR
jgi:hypothetical protein